MYVYDNWEAFASRFTNIWINIKNSANKGVADFMMAIDKFDDYFNIKVAKCDDNCKIEFDMQGAVYDYDKLIKNTQLEPTD